MAKYTVILNSCGSDEQKVIVAISTIVGVDMEKVKLKISSLPCNLCTSDNYEKIKILTGAINFAGGNADIEYSDCLDNVSSNQSRNNEQEKKVCINCGSRIDIAYRQCPNCGYNFDTGESCNRSIKDREYLACSDKATNAMLMQCPACGKTVSINAPACPNCGYPIDTSIRCPKCGSARTKVITGASKATSILLWGPFAANKVISKYVCKDCNHKF